MLTDIIKITKMEFILILCFFRKLLYVCMTKLQTTCSFNLIQKQPSCKKEYAASKKDIVKKEVKSKVSAKKWL